MGLFDYKLKYSDKDKGKIDAEVTQAIEAVINSKERAKPRDITAALNNSNMNAYAVGCVYEALNKYFNDPSIKEKNYSIITDVLNSEKGAGEASVTVKNIFELAVKANNVELVNAILVSNNVLNVNATSAQKAKESFKKGLSIVASDILEFDSKISYKVQLNIEEALRSKIIEYNERKDVQIKGKIGEMVRILGANYKAAGGKNKDLLAALDDVNKSQMKVNTPPSPIQSAASSPSLTSTTVTSSEVGIMGGRSSSTSSLGDMAKSAVGKVSSVTAAVTSTVSETARSVKDSIANHSPTVVKKSILSKEQRLEFAIKDGNIEELKGVLGVIDAPLALGDKNPFTLALKQKNQGVINALYGNDFTKKYFDDALKVAINEKNFDGIKALLGNERKPGVNPFIGVPKEVISYLDPVNNKNFLKDALKEELKKDKIDEGFVKECMLQGKFTPEEMKNIVTSYGVIIVKQPTAVTIIINAYRNDESTKWQDVINSFIKPVFEIANKNESGTQIEFIQPILSALNKNDRSDILDVGLKAAVNVEKPSPQSIIKMLQTRGLSTEERTKILNYEPERGMSLSKWISDKITINEQELNNPDSRINRGNLESKNKDLKELEKLTKTVSRFDKLDSALAKAIKNDKPLDEKLKEDLGSMKTYKLLSSANVLGFEWYDKLLMETLVRPKIVASETYKNIQADYANKKIETRDPYKNAGNDITVAKSGDHKKDAKKLYNDLSEEMLKITRGAVIGKDVTKVEEQDFKRLKKVESLIKEGRSDEAKHEVIKDLRAQYKEKLGEVSLGRQ